MYYTLTLLKDLPKYPKGTQFRLCVKYFVHGENFDEVDDIDTVYYMRLEYPDGLSRAEIKELQFENDDYVSYNRLLIPFEIIDNPDWIKKEVRLSCYYDSKCPKCHSTRYLPHVGVFEVGNKYDGYRYVADVSFECECGHIYNIYKGD